MKKKIQMKNSLFNSIKGKKNGWVRFVHKWAHVDWNKIKTRFEKKKKYKWFLISGILSQNELSAKFIQTTRQAITLI